MIKIQIKNENLRLVKPCNSRHFQNYFNNWTNIDKFIIFEIHKMEIPIHKSEKIDCLYLINLSKFSFIRILFMIKLSYFFPFDYCNHLEEMEWISYNRFKKMLNK